MVTDVHFAKALDFNIWFRFTPGEVLPNSVQNKALEQFKDDLIKTFHFWQTDIQLHMLSKVMFSTFGIIL